MSKRYYSVEIAEKLGRDESDIICTIYEWLHTYSKKPLKYRENFRDGCWWSYNSVQKWREQFKWIGLTAFKSKMGKLREQGYLVKSSKEYNRKYKGKNSTSWFTLDLEKIHSDFPTTKKDLPILPIPDDADMVENRPISKSENDQQLDGFRPTGRSDSDQGLVEKRPTGRSDSDQTIPYTLPSNKDKNNNLIPYDEDTADIRDDKEEVNNSEKKKSLSLPLQTVKRILETDGYYSQIAQRRKDLFLDFFGRYFEAYRKYKGQEHLSVSEGSMKKAMDNVRVCEAHEHPEIIPLYFQSEFKPKENKDNLKYGKGLKQCDYRIYHFTTIGVLQGMLKQLGNNADDNQSERVPEPEEHEQSKTERKPETVQHAEIETWYYEAPEEELPFM